jgi:hypothetical protein
MARRLLRFSESFKDLDSLKSFAPSWLILVSAPNFLPVREVIEKPRLGMEHVVRLKRGQPFEIIFRNETGKPLPHPLQAAVFASQPALHEFIESSMSAGRWFCADPGADSIPNMAWKLLAKGAIASAYPKIIRERCM